jgi:hypothetical protein
LKVVDVEVLTALGECMEGTDEELKKQFASSINPQANARFHIRLLQE